MNSTRKQQLIAQTSDACTNMIVGIRQLRLSVLDLFNTLADTGVDPEKNVQHQQQLMANNRLYQQQNMLALATSHSLCTASNPEPKVQEQLERQQQTDLIQYVNQMISSITMTIRSLDQDISVLLNNSSLISTGEAVHLGMDSSLDKHNLYMDLCSSYKTLSKLHEYSSSCHGLLHQQSLKRVHKKNEAPVVTGNNRTLSSSQQQASSSSLAAARSESLVATFNPYKISTSKQTITNLLEQYLRPCEHMEGTYSQPFGLSTGVFQISVNRVLKAILVMRGIMIDAVIVKAYHESFSSRASKVGSSASLLSASGIAPATAGGSVMGVQFVDPENDEIDLWSESKYNVLRRLTHQANAAVLHFQYPTYPEIAVRSFLSWFNSYSDLFMATCSRCNMRLRKFMPPICRDFSAGFHPHHDSCK